MSFQSVILNTFNKLVPSGHTIVNVQELAVEWGNQLSEQIMLRTYERKTLQDLNNSSKALTETTKISVANTAHKEYMVQQGWFNESEINVLNTVSKESGNGVVIRGSVRDVSPDQITLAQDACYVRLKTDPLFQGAISSLLSYTIGNGVYTNCNVPEIQEVIEDFIDLNHFNEDTALEKRIGFRQFVEGESFILMSVDPITGDCYTNFVETNEISDWEADTSNRDVILAYQIVGKDGVTQKWVADYRYFDEYYGNKNTLIQVTSTHHEDLDPYQFIIHIKDTLFPEFHGRPPALPVLKYFKWAEDFLKDRVVLNHERSRVLWKKKILGRSAGTAASYKSPPPSGYMLVETDDVTYDAMSAKINADDVKEDYLAVLYVICAAFNIPIHVLGMRANEQVYASVLSAKAPFTKSIQAWQGYFDKVLTKIFRVVLREKIKANQLKVTYLHEMIVNGERKKVSKATLRIPLVHVFPNPIDEKLNEQTQFFKMAIEHDVVSLRTVRETMGYNSNEEKLRIEEEQKERENMLILKMKTQPGTVEPDPTNKQENDDSRRAGK